VYCMSIVNRELLYIKKEAVDMTALEDNKPNPKLRHKMCPTHA
jgi:hypothetical protein